MRVAVPGAGLMGAQIGVEYAIGGHDVTFVVRDAAAAEERIGRALALVESAGLASPEQTAAARSRIAVTKNLAEIGSACNLVVENITEDLALKGALLAEAGRIAPGAVLASNTSSISIAAIGEAAGFPERTIGTHYWNPPLLMPLVEIIRSDRTLPGLEAPIVEALRAMGKRPVVAERDVPGFVWNRMQLALLREAVWLVEQGVASPETVDQIVREGLARRWRYTGPFQTAALGGAATFERIANNLWPEISAETELANLRQWLPGEPGDLGELRARRDRGLVQDLLNDQRTGRA
ncbi:MAG: 3-hydroxyacyl-CoA dehydrogenase family protein [Thermomicrobiales bacterium]